MPAVLDAGMGMLPWSPLGGGWLSGKYRRDQRPTGDTRLGDNPERGMEAYDRRGTERTWQVIDAVQEIAEAAGRLDGRGRAGLGHRPARRHLDDPRLPDDWSSCETNLRAADLHLTEEETAALDQASDLRASDYPYGETGRRPAQPGTGRPLTEDHRMTLFLTLLSGVAWTVVYVDAIRVGFRDRTYAIPVAALALNIAWESIYAVRSLGDGLDVAGRRQPRLVRRRRGRSSGRFSGTAGRSCRPGSPGHSSPAGRC